MDANRITTKYNASLCYKIVNYMLFHVKKQKHHDTEKNYSNLGHYGSNPRDKYASVATNFWR